MTRSPSGHRPQVDCHPSEATSADGREWECSVCGTALPSPEAPEDRPHAHWYCLHDPSFGKTTAEDREALDRFATFGPEVDSADVPALVRAGREVWSFGYGVDGDEDFTVLYEEDLWAFEGEDADDAVVRSWAPFRVADPEGGDFTSGGWLDPESRPCPDCGMDEGDHGFDCEEVEHWDDFGTCAACSAPWALHEEAQRETVRVARYTDQGKLAFGTISLQDVLGILDPLLYGSYEGTVSDDVAPHLVFQVSTRSLQERLAVTRQALVSLALRR